MLSKVIQTAEALNCEGHLQLESFFNVLKVTHIALFINMCAQRAARN
jgi:hypothetical protein